jgi:hypothetical protein
MNKSSGKRVSSQSSQKPGKPAEVAFRRSALKGHKFQVGQNVYFTSSPMMRPGATGKYKVVRLLPSDGDDFQYRIKSAGEAFERVAKESQLDRDL